MNHWLRHWGLNHDPFDGRRSPFVTIPAHLEAAARLAHVIETGGRSARLIAPSGLGKSRILARALEETRSQARRFARISGPADGTDLFARLALELGGKVAPGGSRSLAWRSLVDASRVCRWLGLQTILIVDDCQTLMTPADRMDLDRLDQLDPDPSASLTVLRLGRPADESELGVRTVFDQDWNFSIRLEPLTRTDVESYVNAKLEAAGRAEPTFTPRAITRLHAASGGIPRGIDRIGSLALMSSAIRGLEMVSPEVIDEAASECSAIEPSLIEF